MCGSYFEQLIEIFYFFHLKAQKMEIDQVDWESKCKARLSTILDSLVVRISACHVEGPGSIPGRGDENHFLANLSLL